jgi:hybrid cluster-associated redox disulfide protein
VLEKEHMAKRFKTGMLISEALELREDAAEVFNSFGLPCHRCAVAEVETIGQGACSNGLDPEEILAKLNSLFNEKETAPSTQPHPTG